MTLCLITASWRNLEASKISSTHAGTCTTICCKACRNCVNGGFGSCRIRFGWDWKVGLAQNDAKTSISGMNIIRGMLATKSLPGVTVIKTWRQNNWPAITRELTPGLVRAASHMDHKTLCRLWRSEHSYQSWPVLLGCAGTWPMEYEPPHANEGSLIAIENASVDLTSDPVHAGAVFDEHRFFRVTHSQRPPSVCACRRAVRMPELAIVMSVYPTAMGHFVPEQLPSVLLLHALLPPHVPIIIAQSVISRRYLLPLIHAGVVQPDRFVFTPLEQDGTSYEADRVYTLLNSHFSNAMSGDLAMGRAREFYSPRGSVSRILRTKVVVIDRAKKARCVSNQLEMLHAIQRIIDTDYKALGLELEVWQPSEHNVTVDIDMFRHAALIVGPHGAGLANIMFAAEGTPVIEICYSESSPMYCPAMYAAMAANLHLPYWVILGKGSYSTSMVVDMRQLSRSVYAALETLRVLRAPLRRAGKPVVGIVRTADPESRKVGAVMGDIVRRLCLSRSCTLEAAARNNCSWAKSTTV